MTAIVIAFLLAIPAFLAAKNRAMRLSENGIGGFAVRPSARPIYHGIYAALWTALPAFLILAAWSAMEMRVGEFFLTNSLPESIRQLPSAEREFFIADLIQNPNSADSALRESSANFFIAQNLGRGITAILAIAAAIFFWRKSSGRIALRFNARERVEKFIKAAMLFAAAVATLTTAGIVLSLIFEAARFFAVASVGEFLFGLHWSPQTAVREDQVGSSGGFGAVPLFAGTLLITGIAISIAAPLGLMAAIYLSEYATPAARKTLKPLLEILAGVPTVVYGFFAALTLAPLIRSTAESAGMAASSESALAAGIVMGVMIIPFVSSLADDALHSVPQTLRDASTALGATTAETICRAVIPAAAPGILSALLLAISRAIGETMIVVMAAGLAANLTANPFEAVTTVTVQIVTLLVGDQQFDSPKTLAAFALGLALFIATLALNLAALLTIRRYRKKYA